MSVQILEVAPTSCTRPHELVGTLEAVLWAVQCQIKVVQCQIKEAVTMKSRKLCATEKVSSLEFVADKESSYEVFAPLLRERGKTCKVLADVERWQASWGSLRQALTRRTPPSRGVLRGLMVTQERALQSIAQGSYFVVLLADA